MITGYDVDGVLADFSGYVLRKLGLDPSLQKHWDFTTDYGEAVNREVYRMMGDPVTWVSLPVLPGAKEAVEISGRKGRVAFISSMPPEFYRLRQWWLSFHFPYQAELYICKSHEKVSMAHWLSVSRFIEDKTETANEMAASGIESWLVPTPYTGTPDARVRIGTVGEYARGG